MAYKNNIPQSNDKTKQSVRDIQNNWAAYQGAFSVDHIGLGLENSGRHKFVHLTEQGADPATAVNEGGLYAKVGAVSGETEVYWRRENNGPVVIGTEGTKASTGWNSTFSGLVQKWGSFTPGAAVTSETQVYGIGIAFSSVFFIGVTIYAPNQSDIIVNIPAYNTTQFDWELYQRTAPGVAQAPGAGAFIRWHVMGIK